MSDTTQQEQDQEFPTIYRNMMAVGLLGACYQVHDDAQKVNDAVEATLADVAPFRMYRALAQGIGGDGAYASEQIGKRLEESPDDDKAKVALAVSLMLAGNPEWKGLIENVLATSSDQVARAAATEVIDYLRALPVH
ncbi:MAG TPA: hypothetical protein VF169_01185 [Albitalea sp.]|uniref:hypothetical protein n=1 Tax=Piscinibacter sp. TaxID=1903157 RepID=UPI002ED2B8B8